MRWRKGNELGCRLRDGNVLATAEWAKKHEGTRVRAPRSFDGGVGEVGEAAQEGVRVTTEPVVPGEGVGTPTNRPTNTICTDCDLAISHQIADAGRAESSLVIDKGGKHCEGIRVCDAAHFPEADQPTEAASALIAIWMLGTEHLGWMYPTHQVKWEDIS